jgi:hypothetical protein
MIVRRMPDGSALLISQEGHADVAAQFAAHWGNDEFSTLDPYQSMVFATIYHDSGHREMEADLPIDPERGLPYNFRGAPAAVRRRDADFTNVQWIHARDPYASLVVSMHRAGLGKRRYDTIRLRRADSPDQHPTADRSPAGDGVGLDVDAAFEDLEGWQRETAEQLGLAAPAAREAFWHNYSVLQVFDLLSLHFCCDGYDGHEMQEVTLERVPAMYGSDRIVEVHLVPTGPGSLRMTPYPFDMVPLQVSVMARQMTPLVDEPDLVAREAYHRAPRHPLTWDLTD